MSSHRPTLDARAVMRVLKALADPTRFRITQEIAAAGELTCTQLTELFDVSQPTISHHIKILNDAGVLVRRAEGKHHYTSVDHALVAEVARLLPELLGADATRIARDKARAS
ncbi:MAG TPA: metalloregulator ArsR/SmtB family transcription factor [Byssovorax sp.]|jgi:ArsR family transcriptional regulator